MSSGTGAGGLTPDYEVTAQTSPDTNALAATRTKTKRRAAPGDTDVSRKRMPGAKPRASQACKACAVAKVRCDDLQTCRRCQAKGVPCLRTFQLRLVGVNKKSVASSSSTASSLTPAPEQSHCHDSSRPWLTTKRDASGTIFGPRGKTLIPSDADSSLCSIGENGKNRKNSQSLALSTSPPTSWPEPDTFHESQRGLGSYATLAFDPTFQVDWQENGIFDFLTSTPQEWPDLGPFGSGNCDTILGSLPNANHQDSAAFGAIEETLTTASLTSSETRISKEAVKAYHSSLGNWHPTPKDYLTPDKASVSIAPEVQKAMLGCLGNLDPAIIPGQLLAPRRDEMIVVVAGRFSTGQPLQVIPSFPSIEVLDQLLKIFLTMQKAHLSSFVHLSTFDPEACDLSLLMACIAAGAVASPNLAAHKFGLALVEVLRWHLPTLADRENTMTRSTPFIQSLVIVCDIALWSGDKRKSEISDIISEFAATMMRHARRFAGPSYPSTVLMLGEAPTHPAETWRRWVEQESAKRTVYQHFMKCTQRAVVRNTVAMISCTEICTPVPEHDILWFARSAAEWNSIHVELQGKLEGGQRLSLMHCLANATASQSLLPLQDPNLARLMIIYSLVSMLAEDRRRSIVFNIQADGDWDCPGVPASSASRHLALLVDEMRGSMDKDASARDSVGATFMLEFYGLYSAVPSYLTEALLGDERFITAHEALCRLKDWRRTRRARAAIWHAGQLLRLSRSTEPERRTDFEVFAIYQSMLCLWMYAIVCETTPSPDTATAHETEPGTPTHETKIRLDGLESLQTQRWISHNHGAPYIAKSSDMVGTISTTGQDVELVPIVTSLAPEDSFLFPLLGMLEKHFSPESTGKRFPILVHVCQVLRALEKYCGR